MRTYWNSHKGVGDEQFSFPVQDQAAVEMTARLDGRYAWHNSLRVALNESAMMTAIPAVEPFPVIVCDVDWTFEGLSPLEMGGIVVRV